MAQVELLWAAASLMLLGALVGMCMKCQQSAAKRENKELHQQRGRHGNRQTFEVIRTYSKACAWKNGSGGDGTPERRATHLFSLPVARLEQMKSPDSDPVIRSSKEFPTSDLDSGSAKPKCQNSTKGDSQDCEATYVDPVATDYYNCGKYLRPPNEKDQDAHAYQNVMVGGASQNAEPDDADDYENSAAIQMWKQSEMSESAEDDLDEPDYVNTGPGALPS